MYKQVLQGQDPHKVQLMLALFSNLAKVDITKIAIYKCAISYVKILPFGLIFISKYMLVITLAETVLNFLPGCVNDILVI